MRNSRAKWPSSPAASAAWGVRLFRLCSHTTPKSLCLIAIRAQILEIRSRSHGCFATYPMSIRRLGAFAEIDRIAGTPDILVNSAGIAIRGPAAEFTLKDWNQVIAVNLTGAFLCAREAGRRMIAAGGGSIVNIASVMDFSGGIFPNVAYQTSKGGIVNLTRVLAVEWAASGIRVNAVAPTYVETDLTRQLLARPDARNRIWRYSYASPGDT